MAGPLLNLLKIFGSQNGPCRGQPEAGGHDFRPSNAIRAVVTAATENAVDHRDKRSVTSTLGNTGFFAEQYAEKPCDAKNNSAANALVSEADAS